MHNFLCTTNKIQKYFSFKKNVTLNLEYNNLIAQLNLKTNKRDLD